MTGHLFSLKNAKMVKKDSTLVVYRDFQKNDFGEKMPPKIYSVVVQKKIEFWLRFFRGGNDHSIICTVANLLKWTFLLSLVD